MGAGGLRSVGRESRLLQGRGVRSAARVAGPSRGLVRPWTIESVFLFDAEALLERLRERGVKIGDATSIIRALWEKAELYPAQRNRDLILSEGQKRLLSLFA